MMNKIVQYTDWLDEECGNMAREGLRTLVVAKKPITEEQYLDFEVSTVIFLKKRFFFGMVTLEVYCCILFQYVRSTIFTSTIIL